MEQNVDTYVLNLTNVDVAYNRSVALLQAPLRQISGRRSLNATLLELRVTAFCDVNYYGANCSVFCLGEDSCRGHYTCGSDGHKSCLPGWKGDDCNSAIPGGVADCGYGKSQYPGRWSGSLSCNTLNESVEISIKSVSNTSSVSGTVKLEDGAYDVVGTWLGSSLLLLPASGPWVTQSPRDISKMSFNINHVGTSFTGQVFETPQPCGHISLTQTSVGISRCQNGATCIRDDASGANICCCAPGFKGDKCEIRIAVPTTRSTTTTLSETSSRRVSSTSMVTSTEAYTNPTNQTTVFTTLPESSTMEAFSSTEPATSPVSTPSTTGSTVFLNATIEAENTTFESQQTTAPVSESSTIQTTQPVQSTTTSEMLSTVNDLQSSTEAESHTTTNQMPLSSTTAIRETTTSNQNPKTTTNPMPEATSTGMPEETTSEELETTSNALSEATTTFLQETTTEELTKSSTIEQETSTTENPLTSTEAETPASTTAGRLTTPPETAPVSTTPTTPVQPIVHDVNMTYSIVLPGVQDDVNETSITHAIADAYEAMNPNLTRSDINMTFSVREGIGEDRAFVVEFTYTLSITFSTVFYKPSMEILRRHILQVYTPGLYEMKVLFYLQNHFQVLLTGTPPSVFQYSSIESVLEFAWKRNRSSVCNPCNITVTIPTIEEVVGADGIAVSKVYYFIHYNGMVQTPGEGGWSAELTGIQEVFQEYNLTLRVYQDKVLPNYRHHYMYSLAFESYVYQESFFEIASQIQQTWMNESLDLASCNCLNVTVVRGDQCITSTGKQVTKIIYFTTISGKLQSPLLHTGPTHEALATGVKIRNPKTKTLYVLLKTSSLTLYKYEQKLAFYVKDVVDTSAITTFVQRLQVAWRTQLNVNEEISVVVPRVTGCIGKTDSGSQWVVGQEVSRLDYYLLYKGEIINPHWNKPVQQTEIIKYVLNVTSTSGHVYQAYTVTKEEIYTREQHHVIHLNGHVVIEEMSDVTTLISKTWSTVYQSAVSVSIGFVEEFCATSNRELVTGIFYTLKVNGRIVDASVEYDKVFNSSHLSILLRTSSYRYTVYMGTLTTLISYRYQLSVYFAQTIAELDYAQIAVKLEEGWKTLHAEVTSVKVFVARVEQFYTEEMSVVYRLAYFVRQSGEAVYPLHLPQIPHHRWVSCGCLSVAGISGSAYKLYAGSVVDTASWIPASFHFSLYFQKQVSTLDYVKLEQTIQAAWALRHGNVTVKIVAQEEYVTVSG
ncbi:uncharacterized protein LOC135470609 [Liolophura sinensis]|uniref:uncharacterized protein LOC135470609 n=1 Tax=Liolophura sinensis TaxID=3198878 RepID=UPI003158FC6B